VSGAAKSEKPGFETDTDWALRFGEMTFDIRKKKY
jgi:hypothetical protein